MKNYDYDLHIKELMSNNEDKNIVSDWLKGVGLFKVLSKNLFAKSEIDEERNYYLAGCLTQIRSNKHHYDDKAFQYKALSGAFVNGKLNIELTKQIEQDERIPLSADKITFEHLPIFKEWQEKFDALNNE